MVDAPYWISMFIAGALGTVIGDYCSHDLHLGDAGGSLLLVPVIAMAPAVPARRYFPEARAACSAALVWSTDKLIGTAWPSRQVISPE